MNKVKSPMPKRTSTKEATERNEKSVDVKYVPNINVMAILADAHPIRGEDYAIHLYYKANRHYPFFNCTYKAMEDNNEDAVLVIDNIRYNINIRTGVISDRGQVAA